MNHEFCNKCGLCCNNIAVDFEANIIYFDGIQDLTEAFSAMLIPIYKEDNITYCRCQFVNNNLCTNENKPLICQNYPSSPFAYIPDKCGYSGVIFLKNEREKQKIRKIKEEILHYEALISSTVNKHDITQYQKIIKFHKAIINKLSKYGSNDW